eukprot:CAMPEP_0182839178 /NCGR_PEP_ID=MMETSP0006_2-20121128/23725_1 /TAXON_ID=97485 /ORGANISM="Prymnesium parvum, Strain Texoma1" /LENGTH=104 /DNA_ID=CAMNT_0024968305 /DNA_START=45 /DNA_END=360 /DNA_ORIENTATION=-
MPPYLWSQEHQVAILMVTMHDLQNVVGRVAVNLRRSKASIDTQELTRENEQAREHMMGLAHVFLYCFGTLAMRCGSGNLIVVEWNCEMLVRLHSEAGISLTSRI